MTLGYRYRITGVKKDDPDEVRLPAYDPWPQGVLGESGAKHALWNMREGGPWAPWRDLRVERRPLEAPWEPVA